MIQSLWYIFLVFLLTSCASVPSMTTENQDKEALIRRVQTYWNAKQKDDIQTMTGIMDPDTTNADKLKAPTSFNKYSNLSQISDFKIDNIDMIDKHKATVIVTIQVTLLISQSSDSNKIEQVVTDTWIKKNGYWYISMNKPSIEEIFQKLENEKNSLPHAKPN
jgi:hypothetical protein